MNKNELDIQYRRFVVGERPLCIWGTDIRALALEFLDSLDASYFEYIANTHLQHISEDQPREKESQFAALAIRTAYSQALETLFALLCAVIQAPQCVHAWLDNYQPRELYDLVRRIHERQSVLSILSATHITWHTIAEIVFEPLVLEDKELEVTIKKSFGDLWSGFASQFLDTGFSNEYNSIKHGLRVHLGGFHIAIGTKNQLGVSLPNEGMQVIGKSEFGSRYLFSQKIGNTNHHLQMKHAYRNWSPEDICWSLHLISLSITNIKAVLRILNGVPATEVNFQWPRDNETFKEPWKRAIQIGTTSMSGFQIDLTSGYINPISKQEVLTRYKEGKDAGVRRIVFTSGENIDMNGDTS